MSARGRRPAGALLSWCAANASLAPGVAVFAAVPVLGALGGGFATSTWCFAALFAVALLVVTFALAPRPAGCRLWRATLLAYGAFCAWNFLSILWAGVPADAWEGANRTLLYGLVLVLVGLRPRSPRAARVALGVLAFGTGALALAVLVASAVGDPLALLLEGRLAAPTGYANATAALWLIAFWPALHLASRRASTRAWPLRALALATAALLLQTAVLSQSRGAVGGFAIAALTYLLLAPRRWRAGVSLGVLLGLVAAAWAPLTAVREAGTAAGIVGSVADAREAIALSVLAAFAVSAAGAWAEARLRGPARRLLDDRPLLRRARRAVPTAACLAAVAALAGLVAFAQPAGWTADRWQDFKTSGYGEVEASGTRFTGSLGSNRYDFYRVALDEFRAHAVLGIGSDNFAVPYLTERRSPEAPRYPHSLAFRLLAQLGATGAALFAAFLVLALACVHRRRRSAPAHAGVVAAALAGFAMWLAHGMVDWLWEFPALSIAALGLLALAARPEAARARGPAAPAARSAARLPPVAVALAAVAAGVSFALPGLAARSMDAARESAATNPALAVSQLRRSADLNVLSARPLVAQAVIARRAGLPAPARRVALHEALEREPHNWFAHLELSLLEAQDGRRARSLRSLAAATALNPRQPVLAELRGRIRRNRPVDPAAVEARLTHQLASKLRPAGGDGPAGSR